MSVSFSSLTEKNSAVAFGIHQQGQVSPWSEKIFNDCLTAPYFAKYICVDEEEIGYFVGMQVLDEVTLLDIGIDRGYQGQGFGRRLLEYFVQLSVQQVVQQIWLEVRISNSKAINLYQSVGFNVIDRRKNYYSLGDEKEDAFVMCMHIGKS